MQTIKSRFSLSFPLLSFGSDGSVNIIFSSFYAQIGDSTKVKSKVIKTEKAEEKYSDSISSGNAAIFTYFDENDKNKIIVHIGNIPPKQELIFTSEFIQFIESSYNSLEHELFRNLPILTDKSGYYIDNDIIKNSRDCKIRWHFPIKNTLLVDSIDNG